MAMNGTLRDLELAWKALRTTRDLRVREVACVGAPRTLLCVDAGDHMLPAIALAAGIHGDEAAGPWALLDFVAAGNLDPRYSYRIWPCTNPTGFASGTRESSDGVDLNRTFGRGGSSPEAKAILTANRDHSFALSIDLHEDVDATGFYCYEYGGGELGRAAISAIEGAGLPIDSLIETFDLAGPLDDTSCVRERGRVVADHALEAAALGAFSYSMLLARRAARHVLTFETPRGLPWDVRLKMHALGMSAAIDAVSAAPVKVTD
jgi:murein peptide amidase A